MYARMRFDTQDYRNVFTIKNNHVFYNKECSRIEIKFEEKIVGKNCIQTNLSLIKHI